MAEVALVYAVFADAEAAEDAARNMIERRLAACANILGPCISVYRWEGKVERQDEVPVLFKTRPERRTELIAALEALHSYEVPALLSWLADEAAAPFAAWVRVETAPE